MEFTLGNLFMSETPSQAVTQEQPKILLPHVRSPHFSSSYASGFTVTGPSPEKLVHLTFYYDVQEPPADVLSVEEVDIDGATAYKMGESRPDGDPKMFHEDVARISFPLSRIRSFIDALERLEQKMIQVGALSKE